MAVSNFRPKPEREELESDVQEFLRMGGEIKEFGSTKTVNPVRLSKKDRRQMSLPMSNRYE